MFNSASLHLEEIRNQKAISFSADGPHPERDAWDLCRQWALAHCKDYTLRRCVGFAPAGHHPGHGNNRAHAYVAQMFLYGDEGNDASFQGACVSEVPGGLFLIGDVNPVSPTDHNGYDIGAAMKQTSQEMYALLQATGLYEIDLEDRWVLEEHCFSEQWFQGETSIPAFKLWLPVKVKSAP